MESHPYSWWLAWTLANSLPLVLPHDESYFALRYFSNLQPDGLFLDIGANTGISALSFRRFNRKMQILSMEPNPLHEKRLSRLRTRLAPFAFIIAGAGAREGEASFFTPVWRGIVLHTFTSASEQQVRESVGKSFGERVASQLQIIRSTAKIVRIDDLGIKPTIIKVDAEGFDYEVLIGARKTIEMHRPFLMVEVMRINFAKFQNYFESLHYSLLAYHHEKESFNHAEASGFAFVSGSRNFFAIPQEWVKKLPVSEDSVHTR